MTNPNNAIGTVGAYGGRTSVDAFSDGLQTYSGRGVLSGWAPSPSSGMTITIGGDGSTRDVAIAEDTTGNFTTINNISGSPISVTVPTASATNPRIDLVVAYVNKPATVSTTDVDNPGACGFIIVPGTAASSPVAPNDAAIRAAITADGGTGTTAYYAVITQITTAAATTTITANMLAVGSRAGLRVDSIYPVGSIYMSVNATNPGTIFGGTWAQIKDTFLLSAGDTYAAGNTGGESTHTLTTDEMPSHVHPQIAQNQFQGGSGPWVNDGEAGDIATGLYIHSGGFAQNKALLTTGQSGSGAAHNNMPPYLVVYMWQRTA